MRTAKQWRKRRKWMRKLSAGEIKHLVEWAGGNGPEPTIRAFKENRAEQIKHGNKCWECIGIARKLGLEGTGG